MTSLLLDTAQLKSRARTFGPGLALAVLVAMAAQFLSDHYGAPVMLMAILLGIPFQFLSEEPRTGPGIQFASKAVLRFGVDVWYQTRFRAHLFDPAQQLFYPQNDFTLPPYGRIDAFFGTQVKRAYIWIKMQHATQDLFRPGYMTTPYYPMLNRTLMLGVNWTFFD